MITLILVLLLLGIQLFLLVNLQFTAWPEMLSYPYLRNHGFLMYQDMIHPYPPVLTMILSIIYKIFGYDVSILKVVSWAISLFSSVLVYLLLKKTTRNSLLSFLGLGFYVSIQPFLEGNMLWFDNAIVPAVLAGTYGILRFEESKLTKWIIFTVLAISFAALIKQTAALFLITLLIYLVIRRTKPKQLLWFCLSPLILLVPLVVRLLQEGALEWFINWTTVYPATYWGSYPNYVQMAVNDHDMLILQILLAPPFLFAFLKRSILRDKTFILLVLFLIISLVGIYPRFSFFHFQSALAFSVIIWVYVSSRLNKNTTIIGITLVLLMFIPLVFTPGLTFEWGQKPRFVGEADLGLASNIYSIAPEGEKVFLQGLNSNLYVMSQTIPPKPWTDNFGWYLEIPGVQKQILERWEQDPPKYIFWRQPNSGNWFDLGTYQPKEFVEYYKLNYNFIKEIEPGVEVWQRKN